MEGLASYRGRGSRKGDSILAWRKPGNKEPISFFSCQGLPVSKLKLTPGSKRPVEIVRMGQPPRTDSRVQKGGEAHESCPQREVLEKEAVVSRGHRGFLHSAKVVSLLLF